MISAAPSQRHSRILYAAGVAAPILAVLLTRFAGPSRTIAAAPSQTPPPVPLPILEREAEPAPHWEARARQRARELENAASSVFPFGDAGLSPASPDDASDTPGDTPHDEPDAAPTGRAPSVEPPGVQVTAILSRRMGAVAVVDRRLRHEGDLVSPEWMLLRIEPNDRRVVLRHISGVRREVAISTP